ncbi:MAG: hypothetical protein FD167_2480 [bacterium]|nr:MAG: hypothetical protein FD167_2480 [bacterium]
MRENFSCYENEPVKLGQIKAIAQSVKASRGEQTTLLDNWFVKDVLLNELNEPSKLDELENPSSTKLLSPYVLESGSNDIKEQPITYQLNYGQNYIGRDTSNDLVITDHHISRLHAILLIHLDNRAVIFDLRSLNGVVVNGKRVSEALLTIGDKITLASYYDFNFKLAKSDQTTKSEEIAKSDQITNQEETVS